MKGIKFRVWNKKSKCFGALSLHTAGFSADGIFEFRDDDFVAIQQFTGLQDINGKDIYEGDLLIRPAQSLPTYFEVYWNAYCAKFGTKTHYKHNKMIATYPIIADNFCKMEIAGNIFENPELLKND